MSMDWDEYQKEVLDFLPSSITVSPKDYVFCRDGIMDEKVFGTATLNGLPYRPLFILKEPHDKDGCSVCGKKNEKCPDTKNTTYGMRWIDYCKCDEAFRKPVGVSKKLVEFEKIIEQTLGVSYSGNEYCDVLSRMAIINLKKIGGGGKSDSAKSMASLCYSCHAEKFKDKLLKQIQIIGPSIIICGGTFENVKSILEKPSKPAEMVNTEFQSCKIYKADLSDKELFILDMYHPKQSRLKDEVIKEQLRKSCHVIKDLI